MDQMLMFAQAFQASTTLANAANPAMQIQEEKLRDKDGRFQESVYMELQKQQAASLYKKYHEHIGDMPEGMPKRMTAIAMENYKRATGYLQESTLSAAVSNFDKYALPMIRAVLPELNTMRLFNVQMMYGSTAVIFYLDNIYGTTRGSVTAGQKMFENHEPNYGNSQIDLEVLATGNGSTAAYSGFLGHAPVNPGSIVIVGTTSASVDMQVTDDGNGGLIGDVTTTGTINYTNGAYSFTFNANVGSGNAIEATYGVASEANADGIPDIDLGVTSQLIIARSKKFKIRWSLESQFAMRDNLGLDLEAEALIAASAELGYGIDSANMDNVLRVAVDVRLDTAYQFDRVPGTGISFTEHKHGIIDTFIKASSKILNQSGRAIGNWIVMGENVSNILESLAPRFKSVGKVPATRGILYLGTLDGRWEIFKDMRMAADEWLMGFKSDSFMHAGYVWCPWIIGFTTPTVYLDDTAGRKGIGSLYGQKIVNAKFYLRGKLKP
jgi:hypothetical protein